MDELMMRYDWVIPVCKPLALIATGCILLIYLAVEAININEE